MLPCRAAQEVPKICSQIMKWRNHICNCSSHQQTHHPFFNQRTSRTHFSPLKATRRAMPHTSPPPPKKDQKNISISLHRISPQQQNIKKKKPSPHTNHQTCYILLLSHSISLLATPLNLYGHSQHRHPALLSPQTPTLGIGETVRLTSRYHLLGMYLPEVEFLAHLISFHLISPHTYMPTLHTYLLHTSREMCDKLFSMLLRANGEKQKNECSCWLWHALYLD